MSAVGPIIPLNDSLMLVLTLDDSITTKREIITDVSSPVPNGMMLVVAEPE